MSTQEQPAPHPAPPSNLAVRELPIIEIQSSWYRIHQTHHGALFFGTSGRNRFDAPNQAYSAMYVALQPHGAFIETFGSQTGIRVISEAELSLRSMSRLETRRKLRLVDLTGAGLAKLGADGRLCTGNHHLAQQWAFELWQHPMQADGIYYRARHDLDQYCAAIFNRTSELWSIQDTRLCNSRAFSATLADILDTYDFGLID
jgi:RES domain